MEVRSVTSLRSCLALGELGESNAWQVADPSDRNGDPWEAPAERTAVDLSGHQWA